MTFTKGRLEWLTIISSRDEIDDIDGDEIRELARVALAALESRADAEPYRYVHKAAYEQCGSSGLSNDHVGLSQSPDHIPLYTRPQPEPVVVPDEIESTSGSDFDDYYCDGWNACRAAMLQGKAEPNEPDFREILNSSTNNCRENADSSTNGWIPCNERLPEADGNYWGWWSESKRQGPVWFIKSDLQAQFQSSEITHWMPLPAAPQQEAES